MQLETFRAANNLEKEISELKQAKEVHTAGVYLTGGINIFSLLGDFATSIVEAIGEGLTGLINSKEDELKNLLGGTSTPSPEQQVKDAINKELNNNTIQP